MARGYDSKKWRDWKVRWKRYQASGLTIARFCAQEGVSVNTFHYWARRVGRTEIEQTESIKHDRSAGELAEPSVVRFRLSAAVEVLVPAHCLEVIRCLARAVQQSEPGSAFQEVVLANR